MFEEQAVVPGCKKDPITEDCALCILGAGYAGVGALAAASENLNPGDRVVIIDRRREWGGNWNDQYSFVRLHQPHRLFTAGPFAWHLKKPRDYLATRKEILSNFEDIANQIGKKLKIVRLFSHEFDNYEESDEDVLVKVHSIDYERPVLIRAQKFIRATGYSVTMKRPFVFTSQSIESVAVGDPMLCDSEIRFADRPIYVIGSGKTAMELLCMLRRNNPESNLKVVLIAGRGCCFMVRDRVFATKASRWLFGGSLLTDIYYDYSKNWNGQNQVDCLTKLKKKGIIDSPVSDSNIWMYGILSRAEIQTVKDIVSEVIKGHVDDIVDDSNGNPVMRLRSGEEIPMEQGSIVVNCTGFLVAPPKEKLLSPLGGVLTPQVALTFPGPTSYYLSTVFLRGDLSKVADKLYRIEFGGVEPKNAIAIHTALVYLANFVLLLPHVPLSVLLRDKSNFNAWYPFHRKMLAFGRLFMRRRTILREAEQLKLEKYGG